MYIMFSLFSFIILKVFFFLQGGDSDQDYEDPDVDNCEDNYICAESDELQDEAQDDCEYEMPPSEIPNEIPSHFRAAKPKDNSDYIGDPLSHCTLIKLVRQNIF